MDRSRLPRVSLPVMLALGFLAVACTTTSGPTVTGLAVTPTTSDVLAGGAAVAFTATATYSDASTADVSSNATWTTSDVGLVVVSASGMATAPATALVGSTVTVIASLSGLQGSSTLRVVRAAAYGPDLSNDPLVPQQWHLRNTRQNGYADTGGTAGEDLRLATAWSLGVAGKGVKVAVVDQCLEIAHPDLAANVVPGGSWSFVNGTDDPTPTNPDDSHGTAVSGIVAMVQGNAQGGMGVAPGVSLVGFDVLGSGGSPETSWFTAALGDSSSNPDSRDVWIFNQSWGSDGPRPFAPVPAIEATYEAGTRTLRSGRGAIYVKAAGNSFWEPDFCDQATDLGVTCVNASMDGENTVPYNIVVGALGANGAKTSYSTAGSALWVTAPGGEFGANATATPVPPGYQWPAKIFAPAMVTSDLTGCEAGSSRYEFNREVGRYYSFFNLGASPNGSCDYTNMMNGTSSATPATTGAIALLLDARPELTWREVKHVLARTARRVDPDILPVTAALSDGTYVAEPAWTPNGAGYWFHDWYGFGAVDLSAALEAARTFPVGSLGAFASTGWVASAPALALPIPDDSVTGASASLLVTGAFVVEAVQVEFDIIHARPGDVGLEITSPSGSRSILLNIRNGMPPAGAPGPSDLLHGVFLSNLFYGEPADGTWTFKVVDGVPGVTGTLDQWKIRIYGHK
jgi:subtilisin family serine protease/subtilisin-like proprotein convertase family protein